MVFKICTRLSTKRNNLYRRRYKKINQININNFIEKRGEILKIAYCPDCKKAGLWLNNQRNLFLATKEEIDHWGAGDRFCPRCKKWVTPIYHETEVSTPVQRKFTPVQCGCNYCWKQSVPEKNSSDCIKCPGLKKGISWDIKSSKFKFMGL